MMNDECGMMNDEIADSTKLMLNLDCKMLLASRVFQSRVKKMERLLIIQTRKQIEIP